MFCFFFQAEDGIRDADVTGVQTCALPICLVGSDGVDLGALDLEDVPERHGSHLPRRLTDRVGGTRCAGRIAALPNVVKPMGQAVWRSSEGAPRSSHALTAGEAVARRH